MKIFLIIIEILLGTSVLSLLSFANEPAAVIPLKPSSINLLHSLRASRDNPDRARRAITPPLESLLLEDKLGQPFPIEKVPQWMKDEMEKKIRKVFRQEWLPRNIQSSLIAVKDAKVNEIISGATGAVVFVEYGDFIVLDYMAKGNRITIIDSGYRQLMVRILLSVEREPKETSSSDLLGMLARFFEMSEPAMDPGFLSIDEIDDMSIYKRRLGPTLLEAMQAAIRGERREWWAELEVFFDGQMLLLTVPDLPAKGGELRFSPRLTHPDRF